MQKLSNETILLIAAIILVMLAILMNNMTKQGGVVDPISTVNAVSSASQNTATIPLTVVSQANAR